MLSDRQLYEALVEYARSQNIKLPSIFSKVSAPSNPTSNLISNVIKPHAKLESIDKYLEEDDDLPIIIRNLHSVKSLKHFFEIRTKSIHPEQPPALSDTDNHNQKEHRSEEYLVCKKPEVCNNASRQISIVNYEPPVPITTYSVQVKREEEAIKAYRQQEQPIAPPLPEFLKKLSSLHSHKQHMTSLTEPKRELQRVCQIAVTKEQLVASRSDLKSCQFMVNNASSHGDILMQHHHYYQHHLGRNYEMRLYR
jgi:hypothetical protein